MKLSDFKQKLINQGAKQAFEDQMLNEWETMQRAEMFTTHAVEKSTTFANALDACFCHTASILGAEYWDSVKNERLCK